MKCNKCETENLDESLFCNKCGAKLLQNNGKGEEQLIKSKDRLKLFNNKRNKIILGSALIIIIFIVGIIFYMNNPVSKFKNAIINNNQAEATTLYSQKIKGDSDKENKINIFLKDEIFKIENSFIEDTIDYDKANNILESIKNMGLISSEINTSIDKINRLNNSRSAFKKAEEFIKQSDYVNAIKEYKNVIQDDKNYEKAKTQIRDSQDKYKKQALKAAEESANSNDYDKAISLIKEAMSVIINDSDLKAKSDAYSKKLEEQSISYKKYTNGRYGFSIEYPSTFITKVSPANGDGMIFSSPDDSVELTVSGINNNLNETVITRYNQLLQEHSNANYKKQEGNWFVVSWIDGDKVEYQKTVVGRGSIDTFIISYPLAQKDSYESIISQLNSRFKTPGIESVH